MHSTIAKKINQLRFLLNYLKKKGIRLTSDYFVLQNCVKSLCRELFKFRNLKRVRRLLSLSLAIYSSSISNQICAQQFIDPVIVLEVELTSWSYFKVGFELADIDEDGDLDLFTAGTPDDKSKAGFAVHLNTSFDNLILFETQPYFEFEEYLGDWSLNYNDITPTFCDLDDDGDLDLFLGFETSFGSHHYCRGMELTNIALDSILEFEDHKSFPKGLDFAFSDIDFDGDFDLFYSYNNANGNFPNAKFTGFRENIGSSSSYEFASIDTFFSESSFFSDLADLDNDGDPDRLLKIGSNFVYFENVGSFENDGIKNMWGEPIENPFGLNPIGRNARMGDIDGDGDLDIMSWEEFDDKHTFYFHENLELSNVESERKRTLDFKIYPTPVNEKLFIEGDIKIKKIEIFDLLGVRKIVQFSDQTIDVTSLPSSTYFIRIETDENEIGIKKFVKI